MSKRKKIALIGAGNIGGELAALIARLNLRPHPEGGWYRETFRDPRTVRADGFDGDPRFVRFQVQIVAGGAVWCRFTLVEALFPKGPLGSVEPAERRAYDAYQSMLMEPWDGPAALAMFDGRWAIAGMDRNGLRPMRYALTEDGVLAVGSEAGMCSIDDEVIVVRLATTCCGAATAVRTLIHSAEDRSDPRRGLSL